MDEAPTTQQAEPAEVSEGKRRAEGAAAAAQLRREIHESHQRELDAARKNTAT